MKQLILTVLQQLIDNDIVNISKLKKNYSNEYLQIIFNYSKLFFNKESTSISKNYIYNKKINTYKVIEEFIEDKNITIINPNQLFNWARNNFPDKKISSVFSISARFKELVRFKVLALGKSGKFKVVSDKKIKSLHTKDLCENYLNKYNYPRPISRIEEYVMRYNPYIKPRAVGAVININQDVFEVVGERISLIPGGRANYIGLKKIKYIESPKKVTSNLLLNILKRTSIESNWERFSYIKKLVKYNINIPDFQLIDILETRYIIFNNMITKSFLNEQKIGIINNLISEKNLINTIKNKYFQSTTTKKIKFQKDVIEKIKKIYCVDFSYEEIIRFFNCFMEKK